MQKPHNFTNRKTQATACIQERFPLLLLIRLVAGEERITAGMCLSKKQRYSKGVGALLYGDGTDRTAELAALVYRKQLCTECDAEFCVFNPEGICMLPFVTGKAPRLGDDGCEDYTAQEDV